MKSLTRRVARFLAFILIVGASGAAFAQVGETKTMDLGNFSVSLNVKDIKASKVFYEKLIARIPLAGPDGEGHDG